MTENIHIRLLSWDEAMPLARPVREAVFVLEQRVPVELEWDEWDARSVHAIATKEGAIVGTGRLLPAEADGSAHLGRMAVLREFRGQGVGRRILAALLDEARRRGVRHIDIHAQVYAAGFYRLAGFIETGAPFDEAGIPHIAMTLPLRP